MRKLGKYDIIGEAGRGNMGVVYLGHDPFVDRKVAVKVMNRAGDPHDPVAQRARKLFFNEARAAGSLDHPNILRIYDAGEVDGQPYMVTEFVEGAATLRPYCIGERELLPVERVLELMIQCASALDYAHRRGITHRDIKPANLMLTLDGTIKVVDFGIAQRGLGGNTQVMGVAGSPRYMAPEQARDEPVTSRSDLYSLGVVMYELLTGHPPFAATSIPALLARVLNEPPAPLEATRPDLPPVVARVVYTALEKDPERRFESGAAMEAALKAALTAIGSGLPDLSEAQRMEALTALAFFRSFPAADVAAVYRVGTWQQFGPGTDLIIEGERDHGVYFLVLGKVRVSRQGRPLAELPAGTCFGEMAYLSGGARSATVTATEPVAVLHLETPLGDWASLPVQVRFTRAFQQVLIARLEATSGRLAAVLRD